MMARLAESAAGDAARLLVERQGDLTRSFKDTHLGVVDFATQTDIDAERVIRERLAVSGVPVFGEEEAGADPCAGWCWVVDPIDGTLNWANMLPMFAVSVALCENGVPKVGVVITPKLEQKVHIGIVGSGTWCDGNLTQVSQITLGEAVVAYDGFRGPQNNEYVDAIRSTVGRHRLVGTTATELALCSAGGFAAVIAPVAQFWDIAAGVALVQGAGGVVRDFNGGPHAPGSGSIIAGTPMVVDALIAALHGRQDDPSIFFARN